VWIAHHLFTGGAHLPLVRAAIPDEIAEAERHGCRQGEVPRPSQRDMHGPTTGRLSILLEAAWRRFWRKTDRLVRAALEKFDSQYKKTAAITVGPADAAEATDKNFCFPCALAIKQIQSG